MNINRLRLVNRFIASSTPHKSTSSLRYMINNNNCMATTTAASFHVDIKNNHIILTEEKRVFLEALKLELFNSSRSNVANMIKDNSQQSSSYSTATVVSNDDGFDKSLENSRNLMCHKRHDVLTQQESEYFLYL
ncbi:predicted protein [Naegleria gruberi]|uniref:Predicted protein n=1 Tax=Naegleria gruberi TaxID=5762 RepID=D2VN81_NAEGR|nr:uncharacterized protein NAEGRDRAFT_70402 [Naegleria gruberi]EFC41605.1 predicted protein [Naegleria gruberi]|eukprot:XP_002674349.1 predicted protein [Naegleria gruberi strain NEG-M]